MQGVVAGHAEQIRGDRARLGDPRRPTVGSVQDGAAFSDDDADTRGRTGDAVERIGCAGCLCRPNGSPVGRVQDGPGVPEDEAGAHRRAGDSPQFLGGPRRLRLPGHPAVRGGKDHAGIRGLFVARDDAVRRARARDRVQHLPTPRPRGRRGASLPPPTPGPATTFNAQPRQGEQGGRRSRQADCRRGSAHPFPP